MLSASRAWLRGHLRVPKGINHPSPTSSISLHLVCPVAGQTIQLCSSKSTRKLFLPELQSKTSKQTKIQQPALEIPCFLYLANYSIPLSLRSFCICHVSGSSGEVVSIAAHGSTSWIEFHQALPLTPRRAPEAGAQGLPSTFPKKSS